MPVRVDVRAAFRAVIDILDAVHVQENRDGVRHVDGVVMLQRAFLAPRRGVL
jgi:hypothetical protein